MKLSDKGLTIKDLDFGTVDAEADRRLADYFISTDRKSVV